MTEATEVVICTPGRAYKIGGDSAALAASPLSGHDPGGAPVTVLDLKSGRYRQRATAETATLANGRMTIINAGSYTSPQPFVAIDLDTGLLLHIHFHELHFPFLAVTAGGQVVTGFAEFERPGSAGS